MAGLTCSALGQVLTRWAHFATALFALQLHCHTSDDEGAASSPKPALTQVGAAQSSAGAPGPPATATEWLPLAVGNTWTLEDRQGSVEIRVARRETCGQHSCYVIEWRSGGITYQTEHWYTDAEGIWVAARSMGPQAMTFARPWQFLKSPLGAGTAWYATLSMSMGPLEHETQLSIAATGEEQVNTPAGLFKALRVEFRERSSSYTRWYARGIGLVREDARAGAKIVNSKLLAKLNVPPGILTGTDSRPSARAQLTSLPASYAPRPPDHEAGMAAVKAYTKNMTTGSLVYVRASGAFLSDDDEVVLEIPSEGGGAQLVVMRKQGSSYEQVLRTRPVPSLEFKGQLPLDARREALFLCATLATDPVMRGSCGFLGRGTFADASSVEVPEDVKSELQLVGSSQCGAQKSVRFDAVRRTQQGVAVTAFLTETFFERSSPGANRCDRGIQSPSKLLLIEYALDGVQLKRTTLPLSEIAQALAHYR